MPQKGDKKLQKISKKEQQKGEKLRKSDEIRQKILKRVQKKFKKHK